MLPVFEDFYFISQVFVHNNYLACNLYFYSLSVCKNNNFYITIASCLLVELAPQVNVIAGEDLNITYYFNDEVKNWYNLRIFADNVLLYEKEKYRTSVIHNTSYGDRLVITFREYAQALLWINNMTYTDSKKMTFEYSSSPENSSTGHIKTTNTRFPVDVEGIASN